MSHVADAPGSLARPVRRDWRVPAARALDLVTAVLATLLMSAALFGGARVYFGTVRLSAGSPWRITALLLAVMIVRHVILRHPSTADRLTRAAAIAGAAVRGRIAATITPIWIAARLGVIAIGLAAVATIGPPPGGGSVHVSTSPLVDLPFRWDTGWYLGLAVEGYRWDPAGRGQQNIAFFPGLPFLMRVGGALLGSRSGAGSEGPGRLDRLHARTLVAGWILALAASYAALVSLYRWAWAMAGPRVAASSVALLSAYPFAIYFSAAYTEPFFLLSVLAAFNAVRQQRAWSAGAWGLFAGLVRPNGFLVTIPLLVLALQQRPVNKRLCAAALMPGVGMLIFSAYLMSLTGRPLVWMEAHAAWGRTPPTWQGTVTQPLEQVTNDGALQYAMAAPYQMVNGAALLFALGLAPFVWRRLGAAPALFVLVTVVPPLFAGGVMSMGRVTSTLFPIFVTLAALIPRRHVWAWLVLFALGQGLAAALFFSWRPMV
jgi:Mannosyltransferase (PIG-V)